MINLSEKALGYLFLYLKNYFLQALLSIIFRVSRYNLNHIYFQSGIYGNSQETS